MPNTDDQSVTSEYSCGQCGSRFDNLTRLNKHHRETHVKKFQCRFCDYRCGRKKDMERHEGTHAKTPRPEDRVHTKTPVRALLPRSPTSQYSPRRNSPGRDRTSSGRPSRLSGRGDYPRRGVRSPRTSPGRYFRDNPRRRSRSRSRSSRSPRESGRQVHRRSKSNERGSSTSSPRTRERDYESDRRVRSRSKSVGEEAPISPPQTGECSSRTRSRSKSAEPVTPISCTRDRSPSVIPMIETKDADTQTDDTGTARARVRNLIRSLRSGSHAGGSLVENSVSEYNVPDDVVLIRTTERYLTRHGELVEVITEELKKTPEMT